MKLTALRIIATIQAIVLLYFEYFLIQIDANDLYFRLYLSSQNFELPFDLLLVGVTATASAALTIAFTKGEGVDTPKTVAEPVDRKAPPVEPDTKLAIPPQSGLAKYIQNRSSQYQRVTVGSSKVQEVHGVQRVTPENESD